MREIFETLKCLKGTTKYFDSLYNLTFMTVAKLSNPGTFSKSLIYLEMLYSHEKMSEGKIWRTLETLITVEFLETIKSTNYLDSLNKLISSN